MRLDSSSSHWTTWHVFSFPTLLPPGFISPGRITRHLTRPPQSLYRPSRCFLNSLGFISMAFQASSQRLLLRHLHISILLPSSDFKLSVDSFVERRDLLPGFTARNFSHTSVPLPSHGRDRFSMLLRIFQTFLPKFEFNELISDWMN